MRAKLAILFTLCSVLSFADTFVTIEQSAPFELAYDHADTYATRIYANGVLIRDFSV